MNNLRQVRPYLLMALLLLPGVSAADLQSLMQRLGNTPHATRQFTEQRYSELLQAPMTLRGTLSFHEGELIKAIHEPFAQRFIIKGNTLIIEQGNNAQRQQIALADYPALLTFVTVFRATLQGDLATLQHHYLTELNEQNDRWRMTLKPRDAEVAVRLKEVTIEGNKHRILRFNLEEQNGDTSTLELGDEIP
jgi:hypothetical protein